MADIDSAERRRIVRGLLGESGRGFAEEFGFAVTNNPANLFQLLCLSILLSGGGDYRQAVQTAQALRDRGWHSPARMAGLRRTWQPCSATWPKR
jgi:hypothetical protein